MIVKTRKSEEVWSEEILRKSQLLTNLFEDNILVFNIYEQNLSHDLEFESELSVIKNFAEQDHLLSIKDKKIIYEESIFLYFFKLSKEHLKRLLQLAHYLQYEKLELVAQEALTGQHLFNL